MNGNDLNAFASTWASCMLRACWQGALAFLCVYVICRLFPRLPASIRAILWWLVCVRALLSLITPGLIPLPVLSPVSQSAAPVEKSREMPAWLPVSTISTIQTPAGILPPASPAQTVVADRKVHFVSAISLLFGLYLGLLGVLLMGCLRELHVIRHQSRKARPIDTMPIVCEIAQAMGMKRLPRMLVSDHLSSSLVVGLWRPTVLLCAADLSALSPSEQRALIAHEFAHIQRQDIRAGLLPNIARLLFFFHPLIWMACREYEMARESACDAEALKISGIAAADYGRLLLKLSVPALSVPRPSALVTLAAASPQGNLLRQRLYHLRKFATATSAPPRSLSAFVLSATFFTLCLHPVQVKGRTGNIERRHSLPVVKQKIKKEDQPMLSTPKGRSIKLSATVAAVALTAIGTAPLITARPVVAQEPPATPAVPSAPAVPAKPIAPLSPIAPVAPVVPIAPQAPTSAPSPVDPLIQRAPTLPSSPADPLIQQASRYSFTLRQGNSFMMQTSDQAIASAQRELAKAQPGDCLIVDRDGRRYLITDAGILREIQENFAPLNALGKQMEAKGKDMEDISKPMEELGKQMEALGGKMEEIGKQMEAQGKLMEEAVEAGKPEGDRQAIQEKMRELQEQMKVPQQEMQVLAKKMQEQSNKMRPLSDQQRDFGRKMRELHKRAMEKMNGIIDSAFKKNLAIEQKTNA